MPSSARVMKTLSPIARLDHSAVVSNRSSTKSAPASTAGGMYDAVTANARATASGWLQKNMPAPMGTDNHLWASQVTESALSMPLKAERNSGTNAAAPPQAASTWSHVS